MYTRGDQGKGCPLPEDYHGTAFEKEEERACEEPLFTEEVSRADPAFFLEKNEPEAPPIPCEEREEGACAPPRDRTWNTDILLLSICALLVESEEVDHRLLALLLLLLLSPNT